ncbi:DUF1467 family protein [Marinimicrococcus flavescens]|uniref:DUF1467 family protein n=1 Tax=Marinimicrococcus flavescens TaxID=3031815 RepID=A0AAP3V1A7_9PROT|nr:DUF1467 family protein [Marinimicrococcus flavescens]
MVWFEIAVTYLMVWWLLFFMALPFGVRRDESPVPGTADGAPARPYLLRKVLATTLLAALATWGVHWFVENGFIQIRP